MSTVRTQNSSSELYPAKRMAWNQLLLAALIAIVGSVIVNTVIRAIALALLPIPAGFIQLQMPPIIIAFTIFGTIGATIVFALINRFARNPIRLFRIVALVVLVLTLIPDLLLLSSPTANLVSVATLMVMHVVTCLICIGAFTTRVFTFSKSK